jgi:hypothetical protein
MYSCFMQDNATTYPANSSMTALEEENVQLFYVGQCHILPSKLLNDRPRRGIRRAANIHAECLRSPDFISYDYK